eukprot:scaffold5057_cov134-Skeletonema_marinoi.AAC.7
MSGSKTTSDDEQHHFSSSSGSGHYHHHATTSSPTKRQQNLLQETTAAVPFSSPAISPIPKHNDDENDFHDLVAYPSEIAGSSNDDSESYLLSSMSEEDHLKLDGTAGGSTIAVPQDNATNTTVEKSTPLHMEFELKPSTSSEENKIRSNNSREAHHHQQQQPQQNVMYNYSPQWACQAAFHPWGIIAWRRTVPWIHPLGIDSNCPNFMIRRRRGEDHLQLLLLLLMLRVEEEDQHHHRSFHCQKIIDMD